MRFFVSLSSAATDNFRALQRIQSIVRTFLAAFRADDGCVLDVYAADEAFAGFTVHGVIRECIEQERRLYGATAEVSIHPFGERPESSTGETVELDPDAPLSCDDLFRLFRDRGRTLASAYELENATDMYDADMIAFMTSNGQHFGSSQPESMHQQFSYITDPLNNVTSVLDVGCGAGSIYDQLRRYCLVDGQRMPHYAGVDYSRSQIERARRKYPHGIFQTGDASDLLFPDNSFDVVVCSSVLQFLPKDRVMAGLAEVLRVGRNGVLTKLLCVDQTAFLPGPAEKAFNYWGSDYPVPSFSPDLGEVNALCEASGKVETAVESVFLLILPNGRDVAVRPGNSQYPALKAYLEQVVIMLAKEYGSPENIPRERIEELMRVGGKLTSADGLFYEIGPGHVWHSYVDVSIMPKGWRLKAEVDIADYLKKVHIVIED